MLYFISCIFLSAFLLFQVQPIIGKLLLPWFGGTPTVWSTVLLFFQLLLIVGYAYSYWLIGHVTARKQQFIHLGVLAISLIAIIAASTVWPSAITPDPSWKPHTIEFPIWHIFALLTVSVGLPYFLLATNAPLMQAWFSQRYPQRSPYPLYAISNIGSLLALISYPFLFEPKFSLPAQGKIWSAAFMSFIVLTAFITLTARNTSNITTHTTSSFSKPRAGIQCLWLLLSACAAILLMATTNQMTQEVAAIPFLWILPLTIYLLSFILIFSGNSHYNRSIFAVSLVISSLLFHYAITHVAAPLIPSISIYSFLLFTCCMICNGELYRLKPASHYLTRFYLMIALGGAIGGIFVNLLAPLIFKDHWELELGVILCSLLLAVLIFKYPTLSKSRFFWWYQTLVLLITVSNCAFTAQLIYDYRTHKQMTVRNFYGVIHVKEIFPNDPERHSYALIHGATLHGYEFLKPEKRHQTLGYYATNSGIGLAITQHPHTQQAMHVGVLGLGAGALATYAKPNDQYRFYEINPAIVALAKGQGGYFHFLQNSSATIQIVLGDARISLEKELQQGQKQHFDILVMDTFSSDAIPMHLLTKEAFAIYLAHLAADGVLAIHITNRNIDLKPVIWQMAKFYHLPAIYIKATSGIFKIASDWILLSHNTALISHLAALGHAQILNAENCKAVPLWTDGYSNLFQILK